jgi:tetratricopeptide (TPR) repeat protein
MDLGPSPAIIDTIGAPVNGPWLFHMAPFMLQFAGKQTNAKEDNVTPIPRTTRIPWAPLFIIAGVLISTLAWMSLPLATGAARSLLYGLMISGAAVALIGAFIGLVAHMRTARGLRINGPGRLPLTLALLGALLAAVALSILPLSGVLAWVGNGLFVLCLAAAVWLGLRLARNGSPAQYRQALHALQEGEEQRALSLLMDLEQERPDFAGTYVLRAAILRGRGDHAAALEQARQLVAQRPELYHGHAEMGLTLLAEDNPKAARQALEQAVTIAPNLAEGHFNLGMACAESGDPKCAIKHLAQALRQGLHDDVAELLARYFLIRSFAALGLDARAQRERRRLRRRRAVLRAWQAELAEKSSRAASRNQRLAQAIAQEIDRAEV